MIYGVSQLNGCHPLLWGAMGALAIRSKYDWKVISGFRSSKEQDDLYAIGRTASLDRPTVTDARGGQSAHNFGLAVDVVPTLDKGATTVSDTKHTAWAEKDALMAEVPGIKPVINISSGRDYAHVEVADWQSHKEWKQTLLVCSAVTALVGLFIFTSG